MLDAERGAITQWLYRDPAVPTVPMMDQAGFRRTGREVALTTPLDEATVRSLKVGDVVLLSGRVYTGRDAVHHHLVSHAPPVDLGGSVIYHCGPVVVKEGDTWRVTAAGPTTSIREEPYQGDIIRRYGVRAVMGKGGMGAKTLAALEEAGAVYLNAIGGAAQFYARCIERVEDVSLLEFGTPEAMWHLQLKDFPAIVTMDAHGQQPAPGRGGGVGRPAGKTLLVQGFSECGKIRPKESCLSSIYSHRRSRRSAGDIHDGDIHMQTETTTQTPTPMPATPSFITVTEAAASKIKELLAEESKADSGLRVFVQGGGCSGFQYGLMIEENGGVGDQTYESNGIRLFVDPVSLSYLKGAEVDFVDTITGGGFTIKNPNATSTCGCGSSFNV